MTKLDAMYWPNSVILETCVPSFTVNVPRVVVGAGEFSDGFRRGRSGADAKYGCSVICSRTSIARRKNGPQRLGRMCDKQSFVAGDECAIDRKLRRICTCDDGSITRATQSQPFVRPFGLTRIGRSQVVNPAVLSGTCGGDGLRFNRRYGLATSTTCSHTPL